MKKNHNTSIKGETHMKNGSSNRIMTFLLIPTAILFALTSTGWLFATEGGGEPSTRKEWRPADPISPSISITQTRPEGQVVARTVFHYDNPTTHNPQTGDFELSSTSEVDEYRIQNPDGSWSDWQPDDVGLYEDETQWFVTHGGDCDPVYGFATTFTPDDTVSDDIVLKCKLVDTDMPVHGSENDIWTGDDDDETIEFSETLTTFMVGVVITVNTNTDTIWEDLRNNDNQADSISMQAEASTASVLEVDKCDTYYWSDPEEEGSSDNLSSDTIQWAAVAGTSGSDYLAQIRGNVEFTPTIEVSGELDVDTFASSDTTPEEQAAISAILDIAGTAGGFIPGAGDYVAAAVDLVADFQGSGICCVNAGLGGSTVIEGVDAVKELSSHYVTQWQSTSSTTWETNGVTWYPVTTWYEGGFAIDMSDYTISGTSVTRSVQEGSNQVRGSYDFKSHILCEEEFGDPESWAEISSESDGTISVGCGLPAFVTD